MNSAKPLSNTITENIGILGGTFDPIHYGHIKPTIAAAKWLGLNEIKLMPTHIPPHKTTTYANAQHRLKMVNLVCQQYPIFSCEPREINRNSPSFTVETLQEIKAELPNSRLFFFIGMDSLINFTSWYQYQKILQLCHLVVCSRPNYHLEQLNALGKTLLAKHQTHNINKAKQTSSGHILLAPEYHYNISSTQLREQLNKNCINKKYLPEAIFQYIIEQKLYSC